MIMSKPGYCTKCGKKAVYHRKYEGTYLCRGHFIQSIEDKVRKTMRKGKMIGHGETVAFAVSGGKDSTAALYMLHKILRKRRDVAMFAITIDEGIAGYRDDSLKIAKKLCKKLRIKHHVFSFSDELGRPLSDVVKGLKKSGKWEGTACTYCGLARRWLLNRKARELGAHKIVFGMNLDDEVQGIMMDYIRGDLMRLARMAGEPLVQSRLFVPRIKPFREIPEREIGLYALLNGLEIQENECPFIEGPRFKVRDFLNTLEAESPGTKFSVLNTFLRLAPGIREVVKKGGFELLRCQKCGEPSSQKICKTCELWRK